MVSFTCLCALVSGYGSFYKVSLSCVGLMFVVILLTNYDCCFY